MSFEVLVEPAAEAEIEAAYHWLSSETSVDTAERWLDSILLAAATLESMPARCARAAESDDCDEVIYQLLFGRRPHVYRMLFFVRGTRVHIVHVRHSARRAVTADELRIPPFDAGEATG